MRRWVLSGVCLAFVVLPLLIACTTSTLTGTDDPTEQPPFGKVTVHWFIGVGTGRTPGAVRAAREFVDEFNDSQGEIELELEVVTSSTHDAIDHLMARIEAGDPPDVIGPADTGWAGEQLAGRLLSLDPALYDFSDVDSRVLDSWQQGGELIGVPAGAFSSAIFYNKELFDAADMPYPPHRFGEPYADGDPWTIEKMEALALKLTLDTNGNDATSPNFDLHHIAQWGFHWQWDSTRSMAVMFGAGSVVDAGGDAVIPQHWREAYNWYYDGMWEKHFIPTYAELATMEGDPFRSGKVAMVHTFMWFSPRLADYSNWDIAAVPAYEGTITTRMERDGILVLNTTEHPEAAFDVAYAIAKSRQLLLAWDMVPTFRGMQQSFIADLETRHPGVDWQVMLDSMEYADTTYADGMPNYRGSYDRLLELKDTMGTYGDLSLDSEIDRLEVDLQALFEEAR